MISHLPHALTAFGVGLFCSIFFLREFIKRMRISDCEYDRQVAVMVGFIPFLLSLILLTAGVVWTIKEIGIK